MPFTVSHVAAVLPGVRLDGAGRGPLVAGALVCGSLAPDVPYYLGTSTPGRFTHGSLAVVTVDVLLAAVLFGLWLFVRLPATALLPRSVQGLVWSLVGPGRGREANGLAVLWFCVSTAVGAATHVFWDSFTHAGRWGVQLVPVLGNTVAGRPLFNYAQHVSSLVGLAVVVAFVAVALRQMGAVPPPSVVPVLRTPVKALVLSLIGVAVLASLLRVDPGAPLELVLIDGAFAAGAGLAGGLLVYAAAFRAVRRAA